MRRLILILAISFASVASAQLESNAPDELVRSLTERVTGFYSDFQNGQFRHAESFVDEESKELYYNVRKVRIMGHTIKEFTWSDDFRSVRVMVTALTLVPMLGSTPLPIPVGSEWTLIDGEWYMHLTPPDGRRMTPFGQVNPAAPTAGGQGTGSLQPGGMAAPSVASLGKMISLDNTEATFPASSTEPITQVVGVTSHAPVGFNLTIEPLRKLPAGLTVAIEPVLIEAGGKATLSITYDPAIQVLSGRRQLDFEVSPTGQRLRVVAVFERAEPVESTDQ